MESHENHPTDNTANESSKCACTRAGIELGPWQLMITQQKNELVLIGKYMAENGTAKAVIFAEIASRQQISSLEHQQGFHT